MKATLMLLQGHLAIPHTYLGLLAFKPKSEIMSDKLHKLSKLSSLNLYFENAHTSATKKLWKKKAVAFPALRKLFIQSRNAIKYTSSDSIETCPCWKGYDCISMTKVK